VIEAGGHAQAAGLSINPAQVDAFRAKINLYAKDNLNAAHLSTKIDFDLEIGLHEIDEVLLKELALLEPHGAGNSHPKFFTRGLKLVSAMKKSPIGTYEAVVGDGQKSRQMQFREEDYVKLAGIPSGVSFEAIYDIRKKSWNGIDSVVLYAKQIEPQA